MQPSNLLIFGGTSLISSQSLPQLVMEMFPAPSPPEDRMIVPTRDLGSTRAHSLTLLLRMDVMDAGIHTDNALDALLLVLAECGIEYCAVVNLVGVLQDTREMPYGPNFQCVYVDLPRRTVAACRRHNMSRPLHMNMLGTDPADPSMYLRSKDDDERVVMNSELDWTILHPSVVFGPRDHFLNLFTSMQRMAPFVPLACTDARFQSMYVDDVAAALVNTLKKPVTIRHAYPLVRLCVYTLAKLVRFAGRASGYPCWIVPLPEGLGHVQATLLEHLPGAPISRDNPDSIRVDNVNMELVVSELGIHSLSVKAVMSSTLVGFGPDCELRATRTWVHHQPPQKHGAPASSVNVLHNRGQCVSLCGGAVQDQSGSFAFALPLAASNTTQLECPAFPRDAGGPPQ